MTDEIVPDIAIRTVPLTDTRVKGPRRRAKLKDDWWRHAIGIVGIVVSLFPVAYVISSAFNRDNTLSGASLIPVHVTTDNFKNLRKTASPPRAGASPTRRTSTGC
jgi:ABC-type maltose transport system permease subunit